MKHTQVSIDGDDAPNSGAPFLALAEYHWVIRERERQEEAQVLHACGVGGTGFGGGVEGRGRGRV